MRPRLLTGLIINYCFCLCLGLEQIIRKCLARRTILQLSQIFLTAVFIFTQQKKKQGKYPYFFYIFTLLKPKSGYMKYHTLFLKRLQPLQPLNYPPLSPVWIKHNFHRIADQDFNSMHAHFPREISQNFFFSFFISLFFIGNLYSKQSRGQSFGDNPPDRQQFFIF